MKEELTKLIFQLNQESAQKYKDGTNPFISLWMEKRIDSFISDSLASTLRAFIEAEIAREEKTKVAGGNYNCGEEGCCPKPKKGSLEENDFEWQIGFNQAKEETIAHLKELLVTLKR